MVDQKQKRIGRSHFLHRCPQGDAGVSLQSDKPSTLCIPASMHESPGGTGVHRIGEADELACRGDRGECLNPRPNRAHGARRISDATPKRKDARRVLWIATNDYCGSCDTTRVIPTSSQDPPATRYSARRCSIPGDCTDIFRHMMKCVIKAARPKPRKCAWCGKRFAPKPVGRPALFCSASCRQRAYEKRRLSQYSASDALAWTCYREPRSGRWSRRFATRTCSN